MSVPKCKECELHERAYSDKHPRSPHYCKYLGFKSVFHTKTWIPSEEMKTSPKWCPKRK